MHDPDTLTSVRSIMNFIQPTDTRPANYLYETEPGYTPPPPPSERHEIAFYDARAALATFTLDSNGFAFVMDPLPALDFLDDAAVRGSYYAGCEELVKNATGATRVMAFDHNVRDKALARAHTAVREPVRFAHNDYTENSAPQRVHDLLGPTAAHYLGSRYMFINVWRPLRGPVEDVPLAVCDAGTIGPDDFVATDLVYADRTGEIYSLRYRDAQRWYFLEHMREDEILLLKCFDSAADGRARYTAHAAFHHPQATEDTLPRRSIEVRTMALLADDPPAAPS